MVFVKCIWAQIKKWQDGFWGLAKKKTLQYIARKILTIKTKKKKNNPKDFQYTRGGHFEDSPVCSCMRQDTNEMCVKSIKQFVKHLKQ